MDVAARLSDQLLAHLRTVLSGGHTVIPVPAWSALSELLRRRPVDVVILEPSRAAPADISILLDLQAHHPAVPVVVYTTITAPAMRATVELARFGVRYVVFRGFDDSPRRFRALLEDLSGDSWRSTLYASSVAPRLARVPTPIVRAVDRLFQHPDRFEDVADLARASGMTRRTVERWLVRAGIPSAKQLVVSARAERAYHLLRDSQLPVADVARRVGYQSARLFARQIRAATGYTPSVLRYALTAEEMLAHLDTRLQTPQPSSRRRREQPAATGSPSLSAR